MTKPIEVVFTFDTTGSMYPVLGQVRAKIKEICARLFKDIPGLRIGIIAHGDYCDAGSTYVTSCLALTDDPEVVSTFVQGVRPTGGGDAPECYELVLRESRLKMGWTADSRRAVVLIGDELPHAPHSNPGRIDWRVELDALALAAIPVYGVQCLGRSHATPFYKELASKSGGFYVQLDQFSYVNDLILAICYQQQDPARAGKFRDEMFSSGHTDRAARRMIDGVMGMRPEATTAGSADLRACSPSRFQILKVPADCAIKDFVLSNDLLFKTGRGFYEFTKTETIQAGKQVILMDRESGDLFEGKAARDIIGLPEGVTTRLKPGIGKKYVVFVQSTSANRKLIGGTRFLYEVDMSR